jgi:uncharacterized protein YndB with AHSA1/START domain
VRWLYIIGGLFLALVVIIGLVAAIGAMLPQGHVATRRARYAQPPARVFAIISDVASAASWRNELTRVEIVTRLPATSSSMISRSADGAAEASAAGATIDMRDVVAHDAVVEGTVFREHQGNEAVTYRVEKIDAPRVLVTRIADTNLPWGGSWTYELTPAGEGTLLTITERGEVYNPIFRFMSRFVFSHTATIDTYLRALGAKLGEATTPES